MEGIVDYLAEQIAREEATKKCKAGKTERISELLKKLAMAQQPSSDFAHQHRRFKIYFLGTERQTGNCGPLSILKITSSACRSVGRRHANAAGQD